MKNENSENDLLSYLQNKQMRTRRLSHAVWNQPISEMPEFGEHPGRRRRSVAPTAITNNYKRRLSLAVPTEHSHVAVRKRGVSVGNVMKGIDSPERRRLRLKKGRSLDTPSEIEEETNSIDAIPEEEEKVNGVRFTLETPTPQQTKGKKQDTEQVNKGSPKANLFLRGERRHGKLKRASTVDEQELHGSANARRDDLSPKRSLKRYGSDKEQRRQSPRTVHFADKPDKSVKFVSPKHSPSAGRRKTMLKSHAKSLDEGCEEAMRDGQHLDHDISPKGSLRKNPSYNKAIFDNLFEFEDEND